MKPEITTTEDTRCLTDRWGQVLDLDPPASEGEREIVESLRASMYDEITFAVRRDTAYGLLLELEYDDGQYPNDHEAGLMDETKTLFPQAAFYFSQGGHTFGGRVVLRAFLPAEHATPDMAERIGRSLFWIMGERVA